VAGSNSSGQPAAGRRAIVAPTASDSSSAATVTMFAVTPRRTKPPISGRNRAWKAGFN